MDGWAVGSSRVEVRLLSGPARRMFMGWIMGKQCKVRSTGMAKGTSSLLCVGVSTVESQLSSKYVTIMEKATGMKTKITGALHTLGVICTANFISESRKLLSHHRMGPQHVDHSHGHPKVERSRIPMLCHAIPSRKHGHWQFLIQLAHIQRSYDTESQRVFLPNHRPSGPTLSSK